MGQVGRLRLAMTRDLSRKGFWLWFAVHLGLSLALTALWVGLAEIWLDDRPLLVIVSLRLLLIGPQLSVYVRRLHDAGRSGIWALCLLALYAAGLVAFIHLQHRVDGWGAELAPIRQHAPDEGSGNVQALYNYELQNVLLVGTGVLTGLPGPLQLAFAGVVGSLKPKTAV